MQAVYRHGCICLHTTHATYRPFTANSHSCPRAHLFISLYLLGPTDNADPPTNTQMRPFPLKQGVEAFTPSAMCFCPTFFLLHGRALGFQPIRLRHKVRWTWRIGLTACQAKRFGPQTQLRCSWLNCLNQVCEVKVCPIMNELSLPNFFQVRRTPRTRFMKQKCVQLRMGFNCDHFVLVPKFSFYDT